MLAVATTHHLAFLSPATLKQPDPAPDNVKQLDESPSASVWTADNSALFMASSQHIHKYDPSSDSLNRMHSHAEHITAIAVKHTGNTVVYSAGSTIYVLEPSSSSGSATSSIPTTHKNTINCLALSTDSSLLASVSSSAVHIHNLTISSTSTLRGLTHPVSSCTFHPHIRTRLLVACERQLMVYDSTRPSAPSKKIPMTEAIQGDLCAVACSPFSKTLVAVATIGGSVGLIDLDKEKGLFKVLNVQVPLTSIVFSPDGASVYLGTETGRILLLDLRSLDKPPKTIILENGARVESMAIQKKIKEKATEATSKTATSATGTGTARRVTSKSSLKVDATAPTKKLVPKPSTPLAKKVEKPEPTFSPLGSPTSTKSPSQKSDISIDLEAFGTMNKPVVAPVIRKPRNSLGSPTSIVSVKATQRERSASSASIRSARLSPNTQQGRVSSSRSTTSLRAKSPIPISSISTRSKLSARQSTPSPDLPGIDEPITPVAIVKKRAVSMTSVVQVLSERLPDNKGKGKAVEFDDADEEREKETKTKSPWNREKENEFQYMARQQQSYPTSTEMQVSPRRPGLAPPPISSPLRPFAGSTSGSAQELLRSLVRDVMFEHQQETKAELMGLHLDLIRAGRGWKQELRDIMEEYMSDLRELREENVRLRKENEMLRRGY